LIPWSFSPPQPRASSSTIASRPVTSRFITASAQEKGADHNEAAGSPVTTIRRSRCYHLAGGGGMGAGPAPVPAGPVGAVVLVGVLVESPQPTRVKITRPKNTRVSSFFTRTILSDRRWEPILALPGSPEILKWTKE
jgi:hypothetical protein